MGASGQRSFGERFSQPWARPFLQALVEPLQRFAHQQPVRLLVVGGPAPAIPGVDVIEAPWSLAREVELIQCMACAIPVIASPVGANVDAVPPTCGLLASSAEDWLAGSGWRSATRCAVPCRRLAI